MAGSLKINERFFALLKTRIVKKRTIVVGLKSDNMSREMLLRLLNLIVVPGDNVLAVHVQESNDIFDPNSFHIHEDLCKSKQVDFQIKICTGSFYISELSHQVRINFATILAIGCSNRCPEDSTISRYLKTLPPSCTLLMINNAGKIILQMQGTSQQGSISRVLQSSVSSIALSCSDNTETKFQLQKSLTMPSSSTSSLPQQTEMPKLQSTKKRLDHPDVPRRLFERLAALEVKGQSRLFTLEELKCATNNFSPEMLIGEGGHSKVYRAFLGNGQDAAVKVLNHSKQYEEDLFWEVEILSGVKHENIVKLLGYCYCREMQAVVYNLLEASLRQRLKQLRWDERMQLAVGVAKALDYLHSSSPPIIHRDVKSSNILLSENGQPQARSLLSNGLCERLIDPNLKDQYDKDEMKTMIIAARLCLLHSSSRRPTMKKILHLFEEPIHWMEMQKKRDELLNVSGSKGGTEFLRHQESDFNESILMDDR